MEVALFCLSLACIYYSPLYLINTTLPTVMYTEEEKNIFCPGLMPGLLIRDFNKILLLVSWNRLFGNSHLVSIHKLSIIHVIPFAIEYYLYRKLMGRSRKLRKLYSVILKCQATGLSSKRSVKFWFLLKCFASYNSFIGEKSLQKSDK